MADPITTSGQIHFSGLGNGTDFDSMITKLVEVEQARITSLETWRKSWTDKVSAFQDLNSAMLSLKTTLEGMDSMGEFLTKSVTSSDTDVLTATAGADAQEGTHAIVVNQIAQNKIMTTTSGYATVTEDINVSNAAVNFVYAYMGVNHTISIPASCSLRDLRDIINADGTNPGVRAAILNDGTRNYLQLRGLDTGSNATLTISASSQLVNFSNGNFATTQANQNALIRVDNWPADPNWISRRTNTISDVLDGVTLKLRDDSAGTTVTLDVVTDVEAVKENVRTFVNQMNVVRQKILDMTKVDSVSKEGSILTGNYGIQIISSKLKDAVASKGVGFDWDEDDFVVLSQLGITTDANEGSATQGLLLLDEETLDAALDADIQGVAELFAAKDLGSTNSTNFSYYSHISGITQPGEYDVSYTVSGGVITGATINGNAASFSGNTITGASGKPEAGLLLTVTNLANGVYTGKAYLKQGKNGEIVNDLKDLTSSTSGPLHILEDNYKDITDMIDKKIDFEETRINQMETRLRERYARLDSMLGYYDQMSQQLSSQIKQLSSSSS